MNAEDREQAEGWLYYMEERALYEEGYINAQKAELEKHHKLWLETLKRIDLLKRLINGE